MKLKQPQWPEPITVQQLIDQLREMPPDAPVDVEGCDCTRPAVIAVYVTERMAEHASSPEARRVLIRRKFGEMAYFDDSDKDNYGWPDYHDDWETE